MNDEHMNKEDKLKFNDIPIFKIIFRCIPERDSRITSEKRIGF